MAAGPGWPRGRGRPSGRGAPPQLGRLIPPPPPPPPPQGSASAATTTAVHASPSRRGASRAGLSRPMSQVSSQLLPSRSADSRHAEPPSAEAAPAPGPATGKPKLQRLSPRPPLKVFAPSQRGEGLARAPVARREAPLRAGGEESEASDSAGLPKLKEEGDTPPPVLLFAHPSRPKLRVSV